MELINKDIQNYYNVSKSTAQARIQEVKDYLKLNHLKRISLHHLAKYEGLTIGECKEVMRLNSIVKTG